MSAPKDEAKKTKHHIGPWVGIIGICIVVGLLLVFVAA